MALYEYLCDKCGARFEKRMPMADVRQLVPCTMCKAKARKTIGNFAFVGRVKSGSPWDSGGDDDMGGMGGMPSLGDFGDMD